MSLRTSAAHAQSGALVQAQGQAVRFGPGLRFEARAEGRVIVSSNVQNIPVAFIVIGAPWESHGRRCAVLGAVSWDFVDTRPSHD